MRRWRKEEYTVFYENTSLMAPLTLANIKKLNAISPNPNEVNVNESTSGIKFTFTFLSSSSSLAIRTVINDNLAALIGGVMYIPFIFPFEL
jgi:hypothetical protein